MLEIYTTQIAKHRTISKMGLYLLDSTVKSGLKHLFAPTWDMVISHKNGTISDSEYTIKYKAMMTASVKANTEEWLTYLRKDNVVIACYCKAGYFCHRHLLLECFVMVCKHLNIPYELKGEIV